MRATLLAAALLVSAATAVALWGLNEPDRAGAEPSRGAAGQSAPPSPPRTTHPPAGAGETSPVSLRAPDRVGDGARTAADRQEAAATGPVEVVSAAAFYGRPFGVGRVEFRLPASPRWAWHDDLPFAVRAGDRNVWYGVLRRDDAGAGDLGAKGTVVTAHFLFRGDGPLRVDVTAGDMTLAAGLPVEVSDDADRHGELLNAWWMRFCEESAKTPAELEAVPRYFVEMLARRLGLDAPARPVRADGESDLERRFERTVGMLFGFESVRLAMMDDKAPAAWAERGLPEPAVHPLPRPLAVRGATVPTSLPSVAVEDLAFAVPEECLYLRCGRVKNYLWVRQVVQGWGGSLEEVVAAACLDHDVRRRLEQQLAFDPQAALDAGIDEEITDCALIAGDAEFRDGAAVGVIFDARLAADWTRFSRPSGSRRPRRREPATRSSSPGASGSRCSRPPTTACGPSTPSAMGFTC